MRGVIFDFFYFITGQEGLIAFVQSLFSVLVVVLLCFPVHECSHALAAHALGDNTASERGRLTLNPLAHIDPMGAICMCICSIGWAKPTPVNLTRCRKVSLRAADIIVSVAGPVSNILMALIFIIVAKVLAATVAASATLTYVIVALEIIAQINTYLAVFNLLPIPPFDGYALIQGVLPRKAAIWVEEHERIINFALFLLLITGALSIPLGFISGKILDFLYFITGFIY